MTTVDGPPPPSRRHAVAREGPTTTSDGSPQWSRVVVMSDDFRLRAGYGSQAQSRMEMTDGERPAAMATDGEKPAATSEERLRLRASDGSQPQSRTETTDGERPAATATDGEVSESQGFHPRVYSTHRLLSHPLTVPGTKVGGSLLQ
jgi:hypothetical protein